MQPTLLSASLLKDRRGVTAMEYALMAGFIGAALVTAAAKLTSGIGAAFQTAVNQFPTW